MYIRAYAYTNTHTHQRACILEIHLGFNSLAYGSWPRLPRSLDAVEYHKIRSVHVHVYVHVQIHV